ncbi:hypothetical protein CRG98_030496 [Punica granatum]|uniref:Uncharacterized protein n=1 Tax=Punica granatum TaxID=22663 RepID=A0A2I0IZP1_PUNGR|nr:hypothetical protein CRG98_030496 [Punica granatum]
MRAYATRLGSIHLPGDAQRTHVRMSRHYLFTIRRSRADELPDSRGFIPNFGRKEDLEVEFGRRVGYPVGFDRPDLRKMNRDRRGGIVLLAVDWRWLVSRRGLDCLANTWNRLGVDMKSSLSHCPCAEEVNEELKSTGLAVLFEMRVSWEERM